MIEVSEARATWKPGSADGEVWLARCLLLLLAVPIPNVSSLSLGTLLALVVFPVVGVVALNKVSGGLCGVVALCFLSGIVFLLVGPNAGRELDEVGARTSFLLLLGLVVQLLVVCWAAQRLSIGEACVLYAGTSALVAVASSGVSESSWKYALAFPVSLLALTVIGRLAVGWVVAGCLGLAGISLVLATRNTAGAVIVAAAASVLYSRAATTTSLWKFVVGIMALLIFGVVVYDTVLAVASTGVFGEELQSTVELQAKSGAPIAGRVEYGATWALFTATPLGLGPGVIPSLADVEIGKTGLAALGVGANDAYVDQNMFGHGVRVHSIAGDLWVQFGLFGALLALVLGLVLMNGLRTGGGALQTRDRLILCFLIFQGSWDLLFSPLSTNYRTLAFAVGICLATSRTAGVIANTSVRAAASRPAFLVSCRGRQPTASPRR